MSKWAIKDAQGAFRFCTDTIPCLTEWAAEAYIELYDNDTESHEKFPEWFPMYVVEIPVQ